MVTKLPDGMFERVAEFRRFITDGMQGGLGVIQELDMTLAQALAVFQLSDRGPMGVTALQTAIGRSQAATSHLVEQLERRGIVRRRADASDRRRRVVDLTSKGRSAVAKIESVRRQGLEVTLGRLPPPLLQRFDEVLGEVLDALRE